jgi:hypothetical protein
MKDGPWLIGSALLLRTNPKTRDWVRGWKGSPRFKAEGPGLPGPTWRVKTGDGSYTIDPATNSVKSE